MKLDIVYLSRRNLLTLLSKLDRKAAGEDTECMLIKQDNKHKTYPQTMDRCAIMALEDDEYYTERKPGAVNEKDEPK